MRYLLALAALCALIYSNSFEVPFQFDDDRAIFRYEYSGLDLGELARYNPSRYLANLSFALNYHFSGKNVFSYHVFNLLVHILATFAAYWLVRRILRSPRLRDSVTDAAVDPLAFFAAALFAAHPLQTESVTYIYQRVESMAGMLYLFALLAYLRWREASGSPAARAWLLATLGLSVCAFVTKPNTVTLPAAILLYEVCFMSRTAAEAVTNAKRSLPFFALVLIPLILNAIDTTKVFDDKLKLSGEQIPYYLTKLRALAMAWRLMFVPNAQTIIYDLAWSRTLLDPLSTLGALVMHLALITAGFALWKRAPIVSFAIGFFYVTLSVTTVMQLNDMFFEHYLYLTLFGFTTAIVWVVYRAIGASRLRVTCAVLTVIVAAYGYSAHVRNRVWFTFESLWQDAQRKSPDAEHVHYALGVRALKQEKLDEAIAHFEKAKARKPRRVANYYRLAQCYVNKGDPEKAVGLLMYATMLDPTLFDGYTLLSAIFYDAGESNKARMYFNAARRCAVSAQNRHELKRLAEQMPAASLEATPLKPTGGAGSGGLRIRVSAS